MNTFLIIRGIGEIDSEKIEPSLEDQLGKMRAEIAEGVLEKWSGIILRLCLPYPVKFADLLPDRSDIRSH